MVRLRFSFQCDAYAESRLGHFGQKYQKLDVPSVATLVQVQSHKKRGSPEI